MHAVRTCSRFSHGGVRYCAGSVPLFQGFKFAMGIVLKNTPEPPGCVSSVS
jgi:hypothetical protein